MGSDIWGFGLALMECAVGRFPYPPTDVYLEMIQYIASEPPPSLQSVASESDVQFSKEFHDFLRLCIEKDPAQRPSARRLKEHAWIRKNRQSKVDIKKWIRDNKLIIKIPTTDSIKNAADEQKQ